MKVKCIQNTPNYLPSDELKNLFEKGSFHLTVGKEYVVYGISEFYNCIWYCLTDDLHFEKGCYPMWSPSTLFKISDPRLSRYWICSMQENDKGKNIPVFSFPEWANNSYFYGNLTDGDESEKRIFAKYRELMEFEFPDYSILEKAEIGDAHWLICPLCIDAWEEFGTINPMVICPKCKKMMHNPRYADCVTPDKIMQNGYALQYADPKLQADKTIVLSAVLKNGCILEYASQELQTDKEIVLAAITQNGLALEYASQGLKANREIVVAAINRDGHALIYASQELQEDPLIKKMAEEKTASSK